MSEVWGAYFRKGLFFLVGGGGSAYDWNFTVLACYKHARGKSRTSMCKATFAHNCLVFLFRALLPKLCLKSMGIGYLQSVG